RRAAPAAPGCGARGRCHLACQGVAAGADARAHRHPRGSQPAGAAHVPGRRPPRAPAGADPHRPHRRAPAGAGGVAGTDPGRGQGAGGRPVESNLVPVRGLRGATTVEADTTEQVSERTQALVTAMLERNAVAKDELISIVFTATDDIHSMFPATAARDVGLGDGPLLCARAIEC